MEAAYRRASELMLAMGREAEAMETAEQYLLAVSVTTGKQGLLKITSDGGSDFVEVDGTGVFGEVDVYVGGSFVGTFSGVKTIKAAMKGGEDSLHVSAVQIGGALDVNMGDGPDIFDLDTEAVADYFASSFVSLAEFIRADFSAYPNVKRWYERMKGLKTWAKTHEVFYGFAGSMKDARFEAV